jgi:hypothetical protein
LKDRGETFDRRHRLRDTEPALYGNAIHTQGPFENQRGDERGTVRHVETYKLWIARVASHNPCTYGVGGMRVARNLTVQRWSQPREDDDAPKGPVVDRCWLCSQPVYDSDARTRFNGLWIHVPCYDAEVDSAA